MIGGFVDLLYLFVETAHMSGVCPLHMNSSISMCFLSVKHLFKDWTSGHLSPFVEQLRAGVRRGISDSSISVSQYFDCILVPVHCKVSNAYGPGSWTFLWVFTIGSAGEEEWSWLSLELYSWPVSFYVGEQSCIRVLSLRPLYIWYCILLYYTILKCLLYADFMID